MELLEKVGFLADKLIDLERSREMPETVLPPLGSGLYILYRSYLEVDGPIERELEDLRIDLGVASLSMDLGVVVLMLAPVNFSNFVDSI
jgi:hypothetical protein